MNGVLAIIGLGALFAIILVTQALLLTTKNKHKRRAERPDTKPPTVIRINRGPGEERNDP